jgi:protein-S-isoprenylcysteine O-methyltransferase
MTSAPPVYALFPGWPTIFWFSYTAWFGVELWIFSRDRRRVGGENKDKGTLPLIVLIMFVSIGSAFSLGPRYGGRIPVRPDLLFPLGIALIWAGIAFRLWAVLTLGRFFRYQVVVQDDHQLITAGPYRFLRNPSYTGGLITVAGIGLALGNWLSLPCMLAGMMLAYALRIRVEDAALRSRFGEAYEAYARRTWAVIPLVW